MLFSHEKLPGLDRTRLLAAIEPVLLAHEVEGVELMFRTDQGGWLLEVTIAVPGTKISGEGVTIDLCTDISRDLSAALDVADVIPQAYQLLVGSPGVDRALYTPAEYRRFAGQRMKVKLVEPVQGQHVLVGVGLGIVGLESVGLKSGGLESGDGDGSGDDGGVDAAAAPVLRLDTDDYGLLELPFSNVQSGRLVFQWGGQPKRSNVGKPGAKKAKTKAKSQPKADPKNQSDANASEHTQGDAGASPHETDAGEESPASPRTR